MIAIVLPNLVRLNVMDDDASTLSALANAAGVVVSIKQHLKRTAIDGLPSNTSLHLFSLWHCKSELCPQIYER